MPEWISLETQENLAILCFQRPPVNAIDTPFLQELDRLLLQIQENPQIKAVVLTGKGNTFSGGLDLKTIPHYTPDEQKALILALNQTLFHLYEFPLPLILALNGHAIAGGLILALTADYRIGTTSPCKLGLTEVQVGIPFPLSAISIVETELAPAVQRNLVLRGLLLSPQEALNQGILDELQSPENLLTHALKTAQEMAQLPQVAYAKIKRQLRRYALATLQDVLEQQNDPTVLSWLSLETFQASANRLKK
jgi:enoyl-CoA hydratase